MAPMKAGRAVSETLRAEGVEYTFGVVGATTNSIVTEIHGALAARHHTRLQAELTLTGDHMMPQRVYPELRTRPEEIADAVAVALAAGGPAVIEIPVAEYLPPPASRPGGAGGH